MSLPSLKLTPDLVVCPALPSSDLVLGDEQPQCHQDGCKASDALNPGRKVRMMMGE